MAKTILPDQSGANGKFLKSNGTDAEWDNTVAAHLADYTENKARGEIAFNTSSAMITVTDTPETVLLNVNADVKSGKAYMIIYKCASVGSATSSNTYVRLRMLADGTYITNSRQDMLVETGYWGNSALLLILYVPSRTGTVNFEVRAQVQDEGESVVFRASTGVQHVLNVVEVA